MAIYLFIVRHGEAEPVGVEDHLRKLTDIGHSEASRTGQWLASQVESFDQVFVSPYQRAQQTKDEIANHNHFVKLETLESIIPSGDPNQVCDELMAHIELLNDKIEDKSKDINVLCVSHMPLVSYLIGELTGYTPIMPTAGVAKIKIDVEKWSGLLETLISPGQMM